MRNNTCFATKRQVFFKKNGDLAYGSSFSLCYSLDPCSGQFQHCEPSIDGWPSFHRQKHPEDLRQATVATLKLAAVSLVESVLVARSVVAAQ
jgi:hypothetical protein